MNGFRISLLFMLAFCIALIPISAQGDGEPLQKPTAADILSSTDVIFGAGGIMPEGVAFDARRDRFLVSSLALGTIFSVTPDGRYTTFADIGVFDSTVGLYVDPREDRLIVANSDARGFGGYPSDDLIMGVAVFDLETGDQQFYADLSGLSGLDVGFLNGVTVDADGNIYVTDSFAPVIYQVTPDAEASVFLEDDEFVANLFGLNGIDYVEDADGGYLLAAFAGGGAIYRIPVAAPEDFAEVEIQGSVDIDGLAIDADHNMVAVGYVSGVPGQQVMLLTSDDDWHSAEIIEVIPTGGVATSVTIRNGVPYYLNAYLNNPTRESYEIVPIAFEFTLVDLLENDGG